MTGSVEVDNKPIQLRFNDKDRRVVVMTIYDLDRPLEELAKQRIATADDPIEAGIIDATW